MCFMRVMGKYIEQLCGKKIEKIQWFRRKTESSKTLVILHYLCVCSF